MEVEVKRPVRPMVYHRKKASRPTHYELALKYAEQRRLRLEQEKAEMDRLTQKHHAPQTKIQPVVPLPMASGIEAAESKEDDDEIRRPVEGKFKLYNNIPIFV